MTQKKKSVPKVKKCYKDIHNFSSYGLDPCAKTLSQLLAQIPPLGRFTNPTYGLCKGRSSPVGLTLSRPNSAAFLLARIEPRARGNAEYRKADVCSSCPAHKRSSVFRSHWGNWGPLPPPRPLLPKSNFTERHTVQGESLILLGHKCVCKGC